MTTPITSPQLKRLITIDDVADPMQLLDAARAFHHDPHRFSNRGHGKTVILLFFNPSLRTRLSTQRAAQLLGMNVIVMNVTEGWKLEFEDGAVMDLDRAEHVREAAGVLSQYADVIGVRTFATLTDRDADYRETVIRAFQRYADVPVFSLESATGHPLQALADWLTISTHAATVRPRVVLTWAPHPKALPQAVANSFIRWMRRADVDLVVTHPQGLELERTVVGDVPIIHEQAAALRGADFVYAKNWSAYQPYGSIPSAHPDWMINADKMKLTNSAFFMHCLPVRRNVVVSDAVLDGPRSLVLTQARNRIYAAQAVLGSLS